MITVLGLSVGASPPLPARIEQWVSAARGDDISGDGSEEHPFASLPRAVASWPAKLTAVNQVIVVTVEDDQVLSDDLDLPPVDSVTEQNATGSYEPTGLEAWRQFVADINIYGKATDTGLTFPPDAVWTRTWTPGGTYSVRFPGAAWTPDQWKGALVVSPDAALGFLAMFRIVGNTTDTLETTAAIIYPASYAPNPLRVVTVPTIHVPSGAGLRVIKPRCSICLGGLNFVGNGSTALNVENARSFYLVGCGFPRGTGGTSPYYTGGFRLNGVSGGNGPLIHACDFPSTFSLWDAGGSYIFFSVFRDAAWRNATDRAQMPPFFECCTFTNPDAGVGVVDKDLQDTSGQGCASVMMWNCHVRNSRSHGIVGGTGRSSYYRYCWIHDCTGSAIYAAHSSIVEAYYCTGTGNTRYGLEAVNGSRIRVNSATVCTGTLGDLKSGNLAVRTYTNFRGTAPLRNQIDTLANTGDGSRIWQG